MASIEIKGFQKWIKRLKSTDKRVNTHGPAMVSISAKGYKDVINHFRTETGPGGVRWKGLEHPRQRGGSKVLQDTGRLRGSIYNGASKDTAFIVAPVKYAAIHNNGGYVPARKAGPGKYLTFKVGGQWVKVKEAKGFVMPQRKFLWISKKARQSMAVTLGRYIVTGRK